MKQKTATIQVYRASGTMHTKYAYIIYRGRTIHYIMSNVHTDSQLGEAARQWALANGFTHCKYVLN